MLLELETSMTDFLLWNTKGDILQNVHAGFQ